MVVELANLSVDGVQLLLHATDTCLLRLKARTQSIRCALSNWHSLETRRQANLLEARHMCVLTKGLQTLVRCLNALLILCNALLDTGNGGVHLIGCNPVTFQVTAISLSRTQVILKAFESGLVCLDEVSGAVDLTAIGHVRRFDFGCQRTHGDELVLLRSRVLCNKATSL